MTEWKETKLSDLISIKGGLSYKGEYIGTGSTILLGMGCVSFNQTFLKSGARLYAGETPDSFLVESGDIVLATRQQSDNLPILGAPAIIPVDLETNRVIVGTNLYKIVNQSEVDNKYLFWLLKCPDYRNHIDSCSKGSTVKMITKDAVESFTFQCPDKNERNRISNFLWNIENKIDLLHRQNTTLELMAETLFRQWFVEEAQEDWENGTLKDEFDFTMGQSPSGASFNDEGLGIPMFQGNADFGFRFPTERVYTTEPTRFAEPMDTLISVRAPVGAQNMAKVKCCIGRGVAAFRYKKNANFYTYTYFKLRSLMEEIKQFNDEGTVFGSISKSDFENLATTIPNDSDVIKFENEAKPINDKIIKNCEQIQTLEKLRDNLLPKLMSGDVRVRDD